MIILVKVSARRYMVLDCPQHTQGWTSIEVRQDVPTTSDTRGFTFASADIITGPADYTTCVRAAAQFAEEHKQTIAYREYDQEQKRRAEEIKRINQEIQERRGKSWIDREQTAGPAVRSIDPPTDHQSTDDAEYLTFETWTEVLAHVTDGCTTYYQAPLDYRPVKVYAKVGNNVIRITPPAGSGADPFTADENHLNRFRFRKDRR